VAGELYIGGDGVARGYVNPEQNVGRFVADPFSDLPGARLYRTGDRARCRADGQFEFLGRVDEQVKIRGYRVEPGEVEQLLREHPSVSRVAVVARERTADDLRLVAYMVATRSAVPSGEELREFLAPRIPEYMIPTTFVTLDDLPTTVSGKIDRRRLPDPDWSLCVSCRQYVAPRNVSEHKLAQIWCELLELEQVGITDNFFDLGGNSLLALRLSARIRNEFSVELPLVAVFAAPDLSSVCERIEEMRTTGRIDLRTLRRGPAIDWDAETRLDPVIRVTSQLRPPTESPHRVLLTGATGFLGAFLLRELLEQTRAQVHCLIRAKDEDAARHKLTRILQQYGLSDIASSPQIVCLCGDLGTPRLGLSDGAFDGLAESIDLILHNGAQVSVAAPYRVLRPANVDGTVEVLRLATRRRVKPLHFVSTLSVFEAPQYREKGVVNERDALQFVAELDSGYAQSKWVAEKLVREAGERGLPIAIYRPGLLSSDSESGAGNLSDYVTLLIKLCVELGSAPDMDEEVNLTPVDYAARSIVALSQRRNAGAPAYHLLNPQPVHIREIYHAIRSSGYPLAEVPMLQWAAKVAERGQREDDEILNALAGLLAVAGEMDADRTKAASSRPRFHIECGQTAEILRELSIACPPVNGSTFERFLTFLGRRGILPSGVPSRRKGKPSVPARAAEASCVIPLRDRGREVPCFCIPGLGGHVGVFRPLSEALTDGRPVYGLQALGLDAGQTPHDSILAMAAHCVREMRTVQLHGPYVLGGWSLGGWTAVEAARQLTEAGETVELVALLDTQLSIAEFDGRQPGPSAALRWLAPRLGLSQGELKGLPLDQQWQRIAEQARSEHGIDKPEIERLAAVCQAQLAAAAQYRPQPYAGPAVLFRTGPPSIITGGRWQSLLPRLQIEPAPGDHYTMLQQPHVAVLAQRLDAFLRKQEQKE
jgi:thioester reductase-like protein